MSEGGATWDDCDFVERMRVLGVVCDDSVTSLVISGDLICLFIKNT